LGFFQLHADASKLKETYSAKPVIELDAPAVCPGIFFHCELVGPHVLPKNEMKEKIREFLYSQLEEEKGLTACLILRTMAKEKVAQVRGFAREE
jgi:UBX domain-containing protein 6